MKLNLVFGSRNILSGYKNIDPFIDESQQSTFDNPIKLKYDFTNLDRLCENGECEEIIVDNILSFFAAKDVDKILSHWISKIKHGGKIIILDIDLNHVATALNNGFLDFNQANKLIYGNQSREWEFRRSLLSAPILQGALQQYGFNIIKYRFDNYEFIIEAMRP